MTQLSTGLTIDSDKVPKQETYTASGKLDGEAYTATYSRANKVFMPKAQLELYESFGDESNHGAFIQVSGGMAGNWRVLDSRLGYRHVFHNPQSPDVEYYLDAFADKPVLRGQDSAAAMMGAGLGAGMTFYLTPEMSIGARFENGWIAHDLSQGAGGEYQAGLGLVFGYSFNDHNKDLSREITKRSDYQYNALYENIRGLDQLCISDETTIDEIHNVLRWLSGDSKLEALGLNGLGHFESKIAFISDDAQTRHDAEYIERVAVLRKRGYEAVSRLFIRALDLLQKKKKALLAGIPNGEQLYQLNLVQKAVRVFDNSLGRPEGTFPMSFVKEVYELDKVPQGVSQKDVDKIVNFKRTGILAQKALAYLSENFKHFSPQDHENIRAKLELVFLQPGKKGTLLLQG